MANLKEVKETIALQMYVLKFWRVLGMTPRPPKSPLTEDWDAVRNWNKIWVAR